MAENASAGEFLIAEYQALREEILATQRRSFQTIGAGAFAVPAINYLAGFNADMQALRLALPCVAAVIVIFFIADDEAVLRCGKYIHDKIEPNFEPYVGWERWLERHRPWTRLVEVHVSVAVSLLFFVYYAVGVWLAQQFAFAHFPLWLWGLVNVLYISGGARLAFLLAKRFRHRAEYGPMITEDSMEWRRLTSLLQQIATTLPEGAATREALYQANVALAVEFRRGSRRDLERLSLNIGGPLSFEQQRILKRWPHANVS